MNSRAGTDDVTLERAIGLLRRRGWIIVLSAVLVAAAAFAFSEAQHKQYTATAAVQILSNPQVNPDTGLPLSSTPTVVDPTVQATEVQLISHQPAVAASTAKLAGHGLTPAAVAAAISVAQQTTTNLVNVSATSNDAALASDIANTYVTAYIASQNAQARASLGQSLGLVEAQLRTLAPSAQAGAQGQALQSQAEALRIAMKIQNGGVQLVTPAVMPTAPSSPKVARNVALGLIVGLLLGLGIAFLLERRDRRIRSVDELADAFRLPLLAAIPRNPAFSAPPALERTSEESHKEVFRLLRAYLRYFNVDKELRVLLVTSAMSGDGKTTVAHNLAEAAQEAGTKTLLLEADMRQPDLARHYGLQKGPGLSEVLVGAATPQEAVQTVPIATRVNGSRSQVPLDVLVAGHMPPNPAELLESRAMLDLLAWASEHYGLVVIDTAPVALVSDAMPLLPKVDGVVLVSRVGKNSRDAAAFLRDRLVAVQSPLLGVVANAVPEKQAQGYGSGYGAYESRTSASEDLADVPTSSD